MPIDRIAPSRRQACRTRPSGRQTWRDLLFVHWEVPEAVLRPLVPASLEIDCFDGRAYVGLVPFTMHDVRIGPVPVADFLETNLRTYVHAQSVPGVWFFSLDAQNALAVWGGRTFYRLPYFRATMSCEAVPGGFAYRSRRAGIPGADLDVHWRAIDAAPHAAEPGTLEHFLTERYALYGRQGNGVYRVRVHHPPWPLQRAQLRRLSTTIPDAVGIAVGDPVDPLLASVDGVSVQTFARERLDAYSRARGFSAE